MEQLRRFGALDSIRGVAALVVVLCHCWQLTPADFQQFHSGLAGIHSALDAWYYLLFKGSRCARTSVIVFFVLSGFVLATSLEGKPTSYAGFAIKRMMRIYPIFVVIVFASYLAHLVLGYDPHPTSQWANVDLGWGTIVSHLLLTGTDRGRALDGVIWTLVHEVRVSLIFPALLIVVRRWGTLALAMFFVLSIAVTSFQLWTTGFVAQHSQATIGLTFLDTAFFTVFFVGGAFVAVKRDAAVDAISKLSTPGMIALAVFFTAWAVKWDFSGETIWGTAADYMRGAGAMFLIAVAIGDNGVRRCLSRASLEWLGRISYSLYLVHMPTIYVVTHEFPSWSPLGVTALIVPLCLVLSDVLYRLVEMPTMAMGRRFAAALGDTHEIRNTGRGLLKTVSVYTPPAYTSDGYELPAGKK
jgi:peptidoglycan/LPS O-acetylase OafA/YrhL